MVLGTATASHLSALERKASNNGLYMKYLSQHLFDDDTVASILQKTAEGNLFLFLSILYEPVTFMAHYYYCLLYTSRCV